MSMSYLDIVLIVILLAGGLNGLRVGLIQSLANLVGWFFAFFFAVKFYAEVAPFFESFSDKLWAQQVYAFAAIVTGVIVLTWLVTYILQKTMKTLKLAPIDRAIGGAFGSLKSLIFILVTLHVVSPWAAQTVSWKNSQVIQGLAPYTPIAMKWSKKVRQQAEDYMYDEGVHPEQLMDKQNKTSTKPSAKSAEQSSEPSSSPKQTNQNVKNPFSP